MKKHKMKHFKYILLVVVITGLATVSCKSLFRKDLSLTLKEYQVYGMPDITVPWNEQHLMKAHVALGAVRMKNFMKLPRRDSRRSGAVFSHILSPDNLSFLNDTTALHDKAFTIQAYWSFINDMGLIYFDNFKSKQYYSDELIDIYIYQLFVRKSMFKLADRIDRSDAPNDQGIKQGRPAIVNGYVYVVESLLQKQEKTSTFSASQLRKLNKAVTASILENSVYLNHASKQKLSESIKRIIEKNKSLYSGKEYDTLMKSLSD
jgi:hypothetical protein